MIIRRIGVLSLGKILGVLYGGIGLLLGLVFALFLLLGGGALLASGEEGASLAGAMSLGMGLVAVVAWPLFHGGIGFLGGLLTALLFNVAAGLAGGLEIETA